MKRCPLDATAGLLIAAIAAAILGSGYLLARLHVINIWEIVGVMAVGGVLVAAAAPRQSGSAPRNTFAHGSARPASEQETKAAAIGSTKINDLHDRTFSH